MQYHSEYNARRTPSRDRTPWNIQARTGNEDVIPVFRHFANLRMNLLPYIASEAWHASRTGIPLMRALPLEFPDDGLARGYPYQYLFGSALLVAPVVEPGREVWPVHLPEGAWYDFWTGTPYERVQVVDVLAPKERIPVFARAGAVLPLNLGASRTIPGPVGNRLGHYQHLCFKIYPGGAGSYDWYDHISGRSYRIDAQRIPGSGLRVEVPAMPLALTLLIPARSAASVTLDGTALQQSETSEVWQEALTESWHDNTARGEIRVRLNPSEEARTLHIAAAEQ